MFEQCNLIVLAWYFIILDEGVLLLAKIKHTYSGHVVMKIHSIGAKFHVICAHIVRM